MLDKNAHLNSFDKQFAFVPSWLFIVKQCLLKALSVQELILVQCDFKPVKSVIKCHI